jgi:hypothetical protein
MPNHPSPGDPGELMEGLERFGLAFLSDHWFLSAAISSA